MRIANKIGCVELALLVTCVLITTVTARAQEQPHRSQPAPTGIDYDTSNTDWNGLYELYRDQISLGRQIQADQPVDLAVVSPTDVLVLIYPTSALPTAELMAFIESGGRVFLADDFGSGDDLAMALELTRRVGPLPHSTFLRGNSALPLVRVDGEHELLRDVRQIVANHPASLAAIGGGAHPIIPYDDAEIARHLGWEVGLLYDLQVGQGRAILLADPSILINFMLDTADNRALVRNVFDALCDERSPCRLTIVTRDTPIVGAYATSRSLEPEPSIAERLVETFRDSFSRVNGLLESLVERRPQPRGVFYASFFLGLGICVFLFSVIPLLRPKWLDFSFRIPNRTRSRSEFEWNLERLARDRRGRDFGLPLAILKDEFEELFLGELAQHDGELLPERRYEPEQQERFSRRYARRAVPDGRPFRQRKAATKALSTLRAFSNIPSRNNLVPAVDERYSERLLKRLYRDSRELLHNLELWEEYERRTGRP